MRGRWSRRLLAGSVLLLGACAAGDAHRSAAGPTYPPIILLSFDTCRADVMGILSGDRPSLTPHLDAFAADAVVFEKAFAQIPHTLSSHMSLFTSVYPDVHGVKPKQGPLPRSLTTLPQILHRAGYRTVGLVTSAWLKSDYGFGRGFDHYERVRHGLTCAERVDAAGLAHLASFADPAPTFLFLHYYDLHSDFGHGWVHNKFPYYAPPAYRKGLGVSEDGREFCDGEGHCNTRYLMAAGRAGHRFSQSEIDTLHGLYRAAVPALDAQIGSFFEQLETRGLYDGSLIVVTADHGEEFHEHGRFIHSQPYDESTHVPLLIKFPRSWKAGMRIPEVVETVDLLPTLLDRLGIDPPPYIQGESLMGLIEGEAGRHKHAVLSQDSIRKTRYALRTDRLKLIRDLATSKEELYDLRQDPGETHNLVTERPEVAKRLETWLERRLHADRALARRLAPGESGGRDLLTAEEKKQLEALGYLR